MRSLFELVNQAAQAPTEDPITTFGLEARARLDELKRSLLARHVLSASGTTLATRFHVLARLRGKKWQKKKERKKNKKSGAMFALDLDSVKYKSRFVFQPIK